MAEVIILSTRKNISLYIRNVFSFCIITPLVLEVGINMEEILKVRSFDQLVVEKQNSEKRVRFDDTLIIIGYSQPDLSEIDWLQCARDRDRFKRRFEQFECLIEPLLQRCRNTCGD